MTSSAWSFHLGSEAIHFSTIFSVSCQPSVSCDGADGNSPNSNVSLLNTRVTGAAELLGIVLFNYFEPYQSCGSAACHVALGFLAQRCFN